MSTNLSTDRLYELLPVLYRRRDAAQGYPLKALLSVIGEQVDVIEDDIEQLYEDWFIETCQDWAVPYIGDLIGYRRVNEAGLPGDIDSLRERQRNRMLMPRREVAQTVAMRRRKGTLPAAGRTGLERGQVAQPCRRIPAIGLADSAGQSRSTTSRTNR